jgi:ABC-2 type transport system ATP-binding protein
MLMEIEVRNLKKSFGNIDALKEINLSIGKGMFGLLGANGAGKTTFMRILTTILPPTSGNIYVDGEDIENIKGLKDNIGYLPQDFSFYPQLTVYEAIDYLAIIGGINDPVYRKKRCNYLLKKVNMLNHKGVKTKALSGGMKRRLGIAQALLNDPKLLIVDEPTAGLDPEERVRFRNMLSDLAADKTVILSTHIVEDIKFTCSKLAVLKEGNLLYSGGVSKMVEGAKDMVWKAKISNSQLAEIRNKYKTISHRSKGSKIIIRILSSKKPHLDNVEKVRPNIEEGYMAMMEGELNDLY